MNIAIIGAGLIGRKRALALPKHFLKIICDIDKQKVDYLAKEFKCEAETDWKKIIENKNIDAVIISTTNNLLSKIATEAIKNGKHVFVEKPGGLSLRDLRSTYAAYKKNPVVVMYGYNHRYHPALQKAKQLIDSKKYGSVLFIRARYGHGGRLGYEKEWRFNKELSGGGELMDQGCHLIDLVNFFCGRMDNSLGYIVTLFWKTNLEDAAFFQLKNEKNQLADLSVTCVEWKNIFSFEIILKTAKIQIDGLGRSYGKEKLTLYEMNKKMGPPKIKEYNFPDIDVSWKKEIQSFVKKIKSSDTSDSSIKDAMYVICIIDKIYKQNII